jgi:hypothetical protein
VSRSERSARSKLALGERPHDRPRSTRLIWRFSSETDDDGVGLLSDAEGGTVAGAEALRLEDRLGQRQDGPGGEHLLAAHDDGAVVEGGLGGEDRAQQVGRQVTVDGHPGLGDLSETGLALEHDEGAVALGRERPRRVRHLAGHPLDAAPVGRREEPAEGADPADPLEGSPELGLEDDDQGEDADDGAVLEDP